MTAILPRQRTVGAALRGWRERRRLSQMDLALRAEVSTRHISFIETGRSLPSREMILRLAEQLDLPLGERNRLLLTGGYAPVYSHAPLDSPDTAAVRASAGHVLAGHEPYPAVVVDGSWGLVDRNPSSELLTAGTASWLLRPPANFVRFGLHPDGMAQRVVNLGEWHAHLTGRIRGQVALTSSPVLRELLREVSGYQYGQQYGQRLPDGEISSPGTIAVPLRIRYKDKVLAFFSMAATFGMPLDIIAAQLAIESFLPADEATRLYLYGRASVRTASSDIQ